MYYIKKINAISATHFSPFFFNLIKSNLIACFLCNLVSNTLQNINLLVGGRRGCDRMVIGFTSTYAISVYHHWCCEFKSRSGRGAQHYVIKFVSDLRQVGSFLRVLRFTHDISSHVFVLEVFASFYDFSLGLWSCSYSVSVCAWPLENLR